MIAAQVRLGPQDFRSRVRDLRFRLQDLRFRALIATCSCTYNPLAAIFTDFVAYNGG